MGVAKNGRGRTEKNWSTIHKVSKLSEVHDPAVGLLFKKKSSGMYIGPFHKKGQISPKKVNLTKKYSRFLWNVKILKAI